MNEKERIILMLFEEKYKALYELLYNNMLLPRTHEIDHEEEREAFDGSTRSLVPPGLWCNYIKKIKSLLRSSVASLRAR